MRLDAIHQFASPQIKRWRIPARSVLQILGARKTLAIADQTVISVANFVSMMIVGRYATQADTGVYHLAFFVIVAVRLIQDSMVGAPLTIFAPRFQPRRAAYYTGSCFALQAITVGAIGMSLLVASWIAKHWYASPSAERTLWLVALAVPAILFRELARKHCFANCRFEIAFAIDTFAALAQVGGLWLLVVTQSIHASTAILMVATASLLATVCWWIRKPTKVLFHKKFFARDWNLNWSFGRWACATQTINCGGPLFANWYIMAVHGEQAAGRVGVTFSTIGAMNIMLVGIANWLGPFAAQRYHQDGGQTMWHGIVRVIVPISLGMVVFAAFLYRFGDALVVFLFGENFNGLGIATSIAAISLTLSLINMGALCGIAAANKPRNAILSDIVFSLVVIVGSYWMIPHGGVAAVFGANVIGGLAQALIRWPTLWWMVFRSKQTMM